MKLSSNKRYLTIALYAAAVLAVNVLLVLALFRIHSILDLIGTVLTAMSPVIWGLVIAFLMNPMMVKIENIYIKLSDKHRAAKNGVDISLKPHNMKILRVVSVTISSLVFLGIVIGLVWVVVPELIKSIIEIFNNASVYADNVQNWVNKVFKNYPTIEHAATKFLSNFNTNFSEIMERIKPMLDNIVSGAWSFVTLIKNFLLGFIVSVYLLLSKDKLLAQAKKILLATSRKQTCEKIMNLCSEANKIFSGFISGKIVDSIIIGMICFIGLTIMDMPYYTMISVLIGVTNIIPFFGPFIGAIPSAIFILLIDPKKVILFIIFVFVLQQFDGNILGPKILGDSTGLPGFWVLISLLVFGGLFGFLGMLLAVPVTALLYGFIRTAIEEKLRKKNLPVDTEYYTQDVAHLYAKPPERKPLTLEELSKIDIPPAELVNEVTLADREARGEEVPVPDAADVNEATAEASKPSDTDDPGEN